MEARVLEEHLCKGVENEVEEDDFKKIEKVLAPFLRTLKKIKHEKAEVFPTDYEELYLKSTNVLLSKLHTAFESSFKMNTLLHESAELLKLVTKSKSVNLYLTNYDSGEIMLCPKYYQNNPRFQRKYTIGTYLAAHVAFTKEYVISSDILGDVRFPQGIPDVSVVKSVICLPIMTNMEGKCIGVIELYRECSDRPYDLINLQICNALSSWMGIAIEQNQEKLNLLKEMEVAKQLCSLVDLYFSGIVPFNKTISEFLKVAKASVNAERGAFYIFREAVPPRSEEVLWADAFEEGFDEGENTVLYKKTDRVKFSKDKSGIPGYAARMGQVVNIQDAYKDARFDKKTDPPFYRTRSIVAIPIKNENGVLGVVILINNMKYPYFRPEDVALVQSFISYASLICGYYFLDSYYNKTNLRLVMTDRLLDFHTRPTAEELNNFKNLLLNDQSLAPGFFKFDWELTGFEDELLKFVGCIFLSSEILEPCFEVQNLLDFLWRIKKSYRPVPYHNFEHAFSVIHFAFNILHRNRETYSTAEVTAILLVALCHDIDHSSFTNSFLALKNDTMYKLYGDLCGEGHRLQFIQFLIQQTDLLSNFSPGNVDLIQRNLKRLMLAFDLAVHFQNRQKIIELLNTESFDWNNPDHRILSQNILLIVSDHSLAFKSFEYNRKITSLLYKEQHRQGDHERMMGFTPLPPMDRNKSDMIPENQIIYLSVVVQPSVEILDNLFVNLSILVEQIRDSVDKWSELATMRGRDMWRINQALVKDNKSRRGGNRVMVTITSTLSSLKTIASDTKSLRF